MIPVETAIRAWVEPLRQPHKRRKGDAVPWRPQPYGQRVLVFDTETTTDHAQRLLFGFFRLYKDDRLVIEGIIVPDTFDYAPMEVITEYAAKHRLPIYSRERFIEEVFYPEVYELGTLCIGYNLPFDTTRVALSAGCGRGQNRRKFKVVLSRRLRWHDLRIEAASSHAAFIEFVPKRKLAKHERPFFKGRFLDLSTLVRAFTGTSKTLKLACDVFATHTKKMHVEELGAVDRRTLTYCRQDVRITWALYRKLREEYARHPFATFANERERPHSGLYMGQIYSSASLAKQYLRLLGFRPLLDAQPAFPRKHLGYGAASYFGGRAEVRVRGDVPVRVVDFTSMYPTIIHLQRIEPLMQGEMSAQCLPAAQIQSSLNSLTRQALYDPAFWKGLNCLVLVEPCGALLPARMRLMGEERRRRGLSDSYAIAQAKLETTEPRWYTLADVVAAVLSGGPVPKVKRAIRFYADQDQTTRSVLFRGSIPLHGDGDVVRTLVEQRQRAKGAARRGGSDALNLKHQASGLKVTANSLYGIFAEINVLPHTLSQELPGTVYSDVTYECPNVHDERPGAFSNPIVASLITGGARLMLALLESEVKARGGTFAFCDTDALAIVCGERCPKDVPCLSRADVDAIIDRFDALNPYEPDLVPHLLKDEYPDIADLRAFSVSAKRYVLYRMRHGRRIQIVKASESGLGAIIGRTRNETTAKLARRIWLAILMRELPRINANQRCRARAVIDFGFPLRRRFPISQPSILQRLKAYNKGRSYEHRVKSYGFVQTVTPAVIVGSDDVLPIAPFELDLAKSKRLPWINFYTGKALRLDWNGDYDAETVPVKRMDEYIEEYRRHPEWKAAELDGRPAAADARGILGHLVVRSLRPDHVGKEIDRLDQDEGASLDQDGPVVYERDDLRSDIAFLAQFPQEQVARELRISVRRWRDILKGKARPRKATKNAIVDARASIPVQRYARGKAP